MGTGILTECRKAAAWEQETSEMEVASATELTI
jgi:hypothetical protein